MDLLGFIDEFDCRSIISEKEMYDKLLEVVCEESGSKCHACKKEWVIVIQRRCKEKNNSFF